MSELPDVSGGETIAAGFTNNVKNRTVMRYANAAARDSSIPIPVEGDVAFLWDTDVITVFGAGTWHTVMADPGAVFESSADFQAGLSFATGAVSGFLHEDGSVAFNNGLTVAEGETMKAVLPGGTLVRWNGDGDLTTGNRRYVWRRSASFGALEFWGYDVNNDGQIIFTVSAEVGAKNLTSESGMIVGTYSNIPAPGKDKFWFQMRNVAIVDVALGAGEGQDGDVQMIYDSGSGAANSASVLVKVNGVWEGRS